MLFRKAVIKCSNLISRNISYVQRARLLEKIKNDDEFCKQSMQTGRFLLYSEGQPLLRRGDHGAHYVDYSYCDKVFNLHDTTQILATVVCTHIGWF